MEQVAALEEDDGTRVGYQAVLAGALGPDWSPQMVAAAIGLLVAAEYLVAAEASTMAEDYWL